jgi:hypothetical protein
MHLDSGGASYIYSKFLQASSEYTKYDCVKNTILIYLFMLLFKTGIDICEWYTGHNYSYS